MEKMQPVEMAMEWMSQLDSIEEAICELGFATDPYTHDITGDNTATLAEAHDRAGPAYDNDTEAKKLKRLLRNRASAAASRARGKKKLADMESELRSLQQKLQREVEERSQLSVENDALRAENVNLQRDLREARRLLTGCHECVPTGRQKNVYSSSERDF